MHIYRYYTMIDTMMGYHQGRMYYKSYLTFVRLFLLSKKSISTVILCSIYFSNLFR